MIRLIEVRNPQLDSLDTAGFERALDELERIPEKVRELQGRMVFAFPDHEVEDIVYVHPKVRTFTRHIHQQIPHLFYYLDPSLERAAIAAFVAAYGDPKSFSLSEDGVTVQYDPDALGAFIDRLVKAADFAEGMADDSVRVVSQFTQTLEPTIGEPLLEGVQARLAKARGGSS